MSLALSFLGGAPFQLLYDGVKKAISTTRNFRTQLINLEFTLGCLQPRIILQISSNNVQLSLPNDIIQDLQVKLNEGIDLVASLSKLSMWNIRIWGNCCNCLKPNYAEQLEGLDRSLNRLLELLRLEQIRNVTLLMLRLDDIERTQSDILQALQDIPGYISRAQQEVIQRMQANVEQQVRNGQGRAAAPAPVVGVVFGMLFDAVTKVKVKNLMFNRLLGELKYSLDGLKPVIEEIANNNKVLHLPAPELEDFVMEMEKAVEFVRKCSKVSKRANYRKYQWTNKLLQLDEHLQRLFTDFNGQLEWKVKEVMDLVSNMEEMMNQTKDSGVVETQVVESDGRSPLPQPHSPSVRLDLQQHMVGTSTHVITEKTSIDTAENEIYIEPPSDVAKLHVKNVQGARDVVKETMNSARDLEVGDVGTEGTSSSSTRNVEETSELKDILKGFGGSAVRMLHNNQTEIVDQHEPPEPTVQFEVADVCETRLKGTSTHVTEKTMEPGPYPERAGEPDCPYYIRTGLCRFGATCLFNHSPNRKLAIAPARMKEEFPERIGQPECQYYLKTGTCKFGATCKFHHPRDKAGIAGRVALNILGYPLRPNEIGCACYLQTGQCKFASTCKFHHPQPTPLSGSPVYPTVQSPTTPGQQSYPGASFIPSPRWQGASSYSEGQQQTVGSTQRNNQEKRRMNSRTSLAQREDRVRRTVYVSDIDQQVTEENLAALFVTCGEVVDCQICGDPNSVLRFAFIEFTDEEGARAALSLAGTMLGFYPVKVLPSKTAIAPVNPTFLPRHEPPEPTVQFEVPDDCETRLKGTVDEQKTTIEAEDQKKIEGKNVAVKNEREVAAAAKLQPFSQKVLGAMNPSRASDPPEMKKLVLKLDLHDDKEKHKALKAVSGLSGVDSIAMDMKERKLTVTGNFDPVVVVSKLRKYWHTEIWAVGAAKEEKKDDEKKKDDDIHDIHDKKTPDPNLQVADLVRAYQYYNNYVI